MLAGTEAAALAAARKLHFLRVAALSAIFAGPAAAEIPAPYVCLRDFYVDIATGADYGPPGSKEHPWKTIQWANDSGALGAGDCVHVAAGNYVQHGTIHLAKGGNANTGSGYVTYIGTPDHATHIKTDAASYSLIRIIGSYIILDGFDIDGTNVQDYVVLDDNNPGSPFGHHLKILNNAVHDSGGGGIAVNHNDYFTVSGNTVFNTSKNSPWHESGISVFEPKAIRGFTPELPDDLAPFHIVISNNIVYDNKETEAVKAEHTDGNGIIIDDLLGNQMAPHDPYPYKVLVQANVAHGNGGKGIHVYLSTNVTVVNNTVFNNNLDTLNPATWRGELSNVASSDTTWINNIAWAKPEANDPLLKRNAAVLDATYGGLKAANVVWRNNITFNGTAGEPSLIFDKPDGAAAKEEFLAANRAGVDPQLAQFKPLPGSPAIGSGIPMPASLPRSLDGRPMANPPNIGAY